MQKKLKNTADFIKDQNYFLATPKNKNPRKDTIDNIEKFNVLSIFSTSLANIKIYKEKTTIGSGININPNKIIKRLELLAASINAGNNGVIPEFSQIAHLLKQMNVISYKQLNDLLKTYINI